MRLSLVAAAMRQDLVAPKTVGRLPAGNRRPATHKTMWRPRSDSLSRGKLNRRSQGGLTK